MRAYFADTEVVVTKDDPLLAAVARPSRLGVSKAPPDPEAIERHKVAFADFVAATLEPHRAEVAEDAAMLARATPSPSPDHPAWQIEDALRDRIVATQLDELQRPMRTLNTPIFFGERIIGPPYDGASVGPGGPLVSVDDGTIRAATPPWSAGLTLEVTVEQPLAAEITPVGTYSFAAYLTTFSEPWNVRSKGGLGLTVYIDGNPVPVASRTATLWNLIGLPWTLDFGLGGFASQAVTGSGVIAEAASPPGSLGPLRLAPLPVDMDPGHRYQISVWAWCESGPHRDFMLEFDLELQCVKVGAGPRSFIPPH